MEANDQLTEGKRKAVRVHIAIIDYFTKILRDLLSSKIAATDLYKKHVLGKCKTSDKGKILGSWEDILQREGHLEHIKKTTDYAEFDITLLYKSLRNFCTWTANEKPTSGWGVKQMPAIGEETVGDDIERMRLLRNKFYGHICKFEISDQEYDDCWTIISDVCERMEKRSAGSSYCQDIKELEKQQMNLDSYQDMKNFIDKNTRDMIEGVREVIRDEGKVAREDHHEVISRLQNIEQRIMSNPQTETEKSRATSYNVRLVAAAVCVVMIAVFFSIFVQDGDKGKNDDSSTFLIMGLIAVALVVIISVIYVLRVCKMGFQRQRNKNDRGILSDSNLADLARKIGMESVHFLCYLGLSMSEIGQIKLDNPNQVVMQTVKGLALWRDKEQDRHFEDLVKDLFNALTNADRNDLVDEITERHKFQVILSDVRKEKNDLTIVCDIVSASNLSYSVTWDKDGSKIDIDGNTEKYSGGNKSEPSLTIHNFQDDCGRYQCFVTSVMGTFDSNKLMNVPEVNLTGPSLVNVQENATVSATYSSPFEITSFKWQKKAPNNMYTTLNIDEEKYTGSSIDKLIINDAKFCDGGEYRLLIENLLGEGKSNEVQLMVKDIFGKKELWKNKDKCDGITRKDRFKLYSLLFWNKKEKMFSCTVEELVTHLGPPYENEKLEFSENGTIFDSEDTEKMTLWDFLHENGDISKNIKFWFDKSADNSILERYCVSSEYSRDEKETAICLPSEFQQEFVKKLDIKILNHKTMKDKSIYPFVKDTLKIPTKILHLGDDALQNYLKQLSKGTVKVYHARGMIVGCDGAGKTTLLKKLKELPIEDILDTKSTRGVDIHVDVFTVSGKEISVTSQKILTHFNLKKSTNEMMETVSDQRKHEVSHVQHNTNANKSEIINEQENVPITKTGDTNVQSLLENKSDERVSKRLLSDTTDSDSQVDVQTGKGAFNVEKKKTLGEFGETENIDSDSQVDVQTGKGAFNVEKKKTLGGFGETENIDSDSQVDVQTGKGAFSEEEKQPSGGSDENLSQNKQSLELIPVISILSVIKDEIQQTITIFDFAGQLAYYVTNQIYLSPRAFYILVIDMTKTLDELVEDEADFTWLTHEARSRQDKTSSRRTSLKERILHWMEMIHALDGSIPVILVATHAEGKSKEDISKFFVQIWKLIPEDIQRCHLSHEREFAVELKKSSGIAEIKESMLNIVSTAEHWGEVRPTAWVMFENYLMKSKMKIKVMKMEDLWTENKKLDREYQLEKKEDMMKMLQFFHDTGTILYFDEDVLRDDIILDVPWFVDAFKHIITDPLHATEDLVKIRDTFVSENFKYQEALDDLQESGMLPLSLLEAIWRLCENKRIDQKDANDTYVQNMQGIMRYMERLGMIAKITSSPEQMWYVPCMNKRLFSTNDYEKFSVSSTVCFKFKFLPQSIYHRLIASCINFLHYKILDWPQPEYFHKNAVLVHKESFDHKYYFLIGSVDIQNIIEIQVLLQEGFEVNRKDSSNFKNEITDQLEKLRKTFHTNLEKFEIGYRCRHATFSDQTPAHFIPEFRFQETTIKCPECTTPNRIVCQTVLYPWNKVYI